MSFSSGQKKASHSSTFKRAPLSAPYFEYPFQTHKESGWCLFLFYVVNALVIHWFLYLIYFLNNSSMTPSTASLFRISIRFRRLPVQKVDAVSGLKLCTSSIPGSHVYNYFTLTLVNFLLKKTKKKKLWLIPFELFYFCSQKISQESMSFCCSRVQAFRGINCSYFPLLWFLPLFPSEWGSLLGFVGREKKDWGILVMKFYFLSVDHQRLV